MTASLASAPNQIRDDIAAVLAPANLRQHCSQVGHSLRGLSAGPGASHRPEEPALGRGRDRRPRRRGRPRPPGALEPGPASPRRRHRTGLRHRVLVRGRPAPHHPHAARAAGPAAGAAAVPGRAPPHLGSMISNVFELRAPQRCGGIGHWRFSIVESTCHNPPRERSDRRGSTTPTQPTPCAPQKCECTPR